MKSTVFSNPGQELEPGRTNQDHCTPQWMWDAIQSWKTVDCDPCSNEWSLVRPRLCYRVDQGQNGLCLPWSDSHEMLTYINCPFGKIRPWVDASNKRYQYHPHTHILMVCPFSPQTMWFRAAWDLEFPGRTVPGVKICAAWPKRVQWDGAGMRPAFTTAVLYWGRHGNQFAGWARKQDMPIFTRGLDANKISA